MASFTDPAAAAPDAQAAEPSTRSPNEAVPSFPLRLESVIVALNVSPGAAKRGASACITRFGATFACTAPAPVARVLYATAVTRTSPTNSGSVNFTSARPSFSGTFSFQVLSGLNRRFGTGLMRLNRSSSAPPPIFTPERMRRSSTIGRR